MTKKVIQFSFYASKLKNHTARQRKFFVEPKHITNTITQGKEEERRMAENMPKEKVQELKEMIQEKKPDEPIDKVLVNFCSRHAVSMKTCKKYYDRMVEKGEVKKE